MNKIIVGCLILSSQFVYSATDIPEGFENFYNLKKENIIVESPLGKKIAIDVEMSYEKIKINDSDIVKINKILSDDGIKNKIITQISGAFSNSDNYLHCSNVYECQIPSDKSPFYYLYDYDKKIVKIFVNREFFLKSASEKKYAQVDSHDFSLISNVNGTFYGASDTDYSGSLDVDNIASIKYGYLIGDFNFSSDSSISELSYNIDFKNNSFSAGYYEYGADHNYNALDSLVPTASNDEISALVSSSDKLLVGSKRDYKRFYFNMPKKGYVEIYKNNKKIMVKEFSPGQQYLGYDELPLGRYNITLKIIVDGKIESTIEDMIYNLNESFTEDEFQYSVKAGRILNDGGYDDSNYVQMSGLYGLSDNIAAFASINIGKENIYPLLGLFLEFEYVIIDAKTSLWDSGNYTDIYSSLGDFSINYQKLSYDDINDVDDLSYGFFGDNNYENINITYNRYLSLSYIPDGNIYASYMKNLQESEHIQTKYSTSTLGYRFTKNRNSYSLNFTQNDFKDYNDYVFEFNVDVDLGDKFSASSSFYNNNSDLSLRNRLNYDVINNGDDSLSLSLWNELFENDKSTAGVELFANHRDQYQNVMANLSSSSNGKNLFVNYDTNVIFTPNDVYQTNDESDSYMVINIDDNNTDYGNYQLIENYKYYIQGSVNETHGIISTKANNQYDISFDSESSQYENTGDKIGSYYSHPGSVKEISPNFNKVKSFLVAFEDINGEAVKEIECKGDGCSSFSDVGDGVFALNVKSGIPFSIYHDDSICMMDSKNVTKGICLPKIAADDDGLKLVRVGNDIKEYYFLGMLDLIALEQIKDEFEDRNIISYQMDSNYFVLIQNDTFNTHDMNLLTSISNYDIEANYYTVLN
ncbi:TcfC E-set like domain-containing protein [Photobacterium damselae subsp. damselae]|uniref:TcfC E-set like domain-containing protein n=1 Tax=Photobacterium damselae TaxID=38293 RepID=UPI00311B07FA